MGQKRLPTETPGHQASASLLVEAVGPVPAALPQTPAATAATRAERPTSTTMVVEVAKSPGRRLLGVVHVLATTRRRDAQATKTCMATMGQGLVEATSVAAIPYGGLAEALRPALVARPSIPRQGTTGRPSLAPGPREGLEEATEGMKSAHGLLALHPDATRLPLHVVLPTTPQGTVPRLGARGVLRAKGALAAAQEGRGTPDVEANAA